jgi:hypothetical protein
MTTPTDNQTARAHPRDNSAGAAGDARSPVTAPASASEESLRESNAASDDAAWEAEVDRVAEPAGSLEDTLRAILTEIADDVV